jgi:hypothetical protein
VLAWKAAQRRIDVPYLDDLRHDGYLVAEPEEGPVFTVLDDGSIVMEFLTMHLAIRLTAADADALAAGVADARRREAETALDDSGLWPIA